MGRRRRPSHDLEEPCFLVIWKLCPAPCPPGRLQGLALPSDPFRYLLFRSFEMTLVYEDIPVEYVFDFSALDRLDVVVKLEGLRTALAVAVSIYSLLV